MSQVTDPVMPTAPVGVLDGHVVFPCQSSNIISFGKHKNKTVLDLITSDPKYILWLSKQQWLSPNILLEIKQRIDTMNIPFGRHEGKSLATIKVEDPDYHQWVLKDTRLFEAVAGTP